MMNTFATEKQIELRRCYPLYTGSTSTVEMWELMTIEETEELNRKHKISESRK